MEARVPGTLIVEGLKSLPDEELVKRVLAGDTALYEVIMRRHNQLLYRVVRSILPNDEESEDVMQDAYVRAYEHLNQFAGRAQFRTWLTRIAVHEALARIRRIRRFSSPAGGENHDGDDMDFFAAPARSPEQQVQNAELRELLEQAIGQLPESYRCVFMLRDVEEISIEEVAGTLDLSEGTVKVRLHRARRALRRIVQKRAGNQLGRAFPFPTVRCDRVVAGVFGRISGAVNP
jgi:RNA polymerase sigma-70 factor (ECF subfamily)